MRRLKSVLRWMPSSAGGAIGFLPMLSFVTASMFGRWGIAFRLW